MAIVLKNKNFAKSTLASGITSGATSLTVAVGDGTKFPSTGSFRAVIWGSAYSSPTNDSTREIVTVTAVTGDVLTITRAAESTTAKAWLTADHIAHVISAGKIDELETEINSYARSIRDVSRGLIVRNNVTNPSHQIDIIADEIVLQDNSGVPYRATAVNLSFSIIASGAGGLDTGTEAASTWYYIWVIYNGTTVTGLLSISSTSPTMPTGYTYKALVGAIYNNASSNFLTTYQQGNKTRCPSGSFTIVELGSTSKSLISLVPVTAKLLIFISTNDTANAQFWLAPNSAGDYYTMYSSAGEYNQGICPIETAQTVYGSRDAGTVTIIIKGWEY